MLVTDGRRLEVAFAIEGRVIARLRRRAPPHVITLRTFLTDGYAIAAGICLAFLGGYKLAVRFL